MIEWINVILPSQSFLDEFTGDSFALKDELVDDSKDDTIKN
jgi:hypothetical protein